MKITTEDINWPMALFDDTEAREEGLHLGAVIKSLMDRSGMGYPKDGGFTDLELAAEIGLLWELALSKIMREKYAVRPPQMEVDGIWMSPDGVGDVDPLGSLSVGPDPQGKVPVVVEEYKATWQGSRRVAVDNFRYMTQVKSYCRALDTKVAVMRIFHIMGDYKGSGPLYRVSRIEFSGWELDQNWDMILKEKERMGL